MKQVRIAADADDTVWQRWYPAILLAIWVLTPLIRRLIDWQIGFNSLSIISLIPISALVPLAVVCIRRKATPLSRDFIVVTWLWFGAFAYSLLVGGLSGGLFGAVYEFGLFCLPFVIGVWIAGMQPTAARRVFDRFARAALWLGAITSAYGIFQFIAPPAWDVAWVYNSELASIGKAEPFGLRIFGTMNSPGVLSDFLAIVILLTLHRLRPNTIWLVAPLLLCTAALTLTFGRTGWLELGVGFVVYSLLSPRRGAAMSMVAVTGILTVVLGMNLSLITGDSTSNTQLQTRLSTFSDIQNDESVNDRAEQTSVALRQALAEPLGQGLGAVGTATKLSASGSATVLDNGYLTRFLEMGVFGVSLYLAALIAGLLLSLSRLQAAYTRRADDSSAAPIVATAIAVQVALIGADLSGDHHANLVGITFWVVIGLTSTLKIVAPQRDSVSRAGGDTSFGRHARA